MGRGTQYRLLRGIAFAALIAFLIPGFRYSSGAGQSKTSIRLGVPFSQWVFVERERNWTPTSERNSLNWRIDFMNWSVCALVVSAAAFWSARRVRPASKGNGGEAPVSAPPGPSGRRLSDA